MPRAHVARALAGALALALLAACGQAADSAAVPTLAKLDGWRPGVDPAEIPGSAGFAVLELAYDEADARALWDATVPDGLPDASGSPAVAGIYGDLADLDLTTQVLGVWSSGQSGSCPGWLGSVDTSDGEVAVVEVQDLQGGDGCTDDYNPYSQVVVLGRDQVPAAESLPVAGRLTFATLIDGGLRPTGGSELRAQITAFAG